MMRRRLRWHGPLKTRYLPFTEHVTALCLKSPCEALHAEQEYSVVSLSKELEERQDCVLLQEEVEDKEADQDPDLAHHVFVPPSALILGEPVTAGELAISATLPHQLASAHTCVYLMPVRAPPQQAIVRGTTACDTSLHSVLR